MKKIESDTDRPLGGEEFSRPEPSAADPRASKAVSVVMPVYNTPEEFLIPALEGILHQSLDNFELLVIDDGSDRPTKDILRRYAAADRRVKIISRPHSNAGQARNEGLRCAEGESIIFLDSDDLFHPDLLRLCYARLAESDADMVVFPYLEYTDPEHSSPGGCRLDGLPPLFSPEDYPEDIFLKLFPGAWNKLFRLSFFKQKGLFFQSARAANDLCCVLTAVTRAKKIAVLNTPLVQYRISNTASIVHSVDDLVPYHLEASLRLKKNLEADQTWPAFREPFYQMFFLCLALRFFDLPVRKQREEEKAIRQEYLASLELTAEVIPLLPEYLRCFAGLIIFGKPPLVFGKVRYFNGWKEIFLFGKAIRRYKSEHRPRNQS